LPDVVVTVGLKIEDYLSENQISKGVDILRISLKRATCDIIIILDDITPMKKHMSRLC